MIDREMDRYQQKVRRRVLQVLLTVVQVKQAFGMDCGESVYVKEGNVTDEKKK